ncbi:LCP family protein [Pseudactinotalea sp.]|uniref:LCP family protein n=1 Tax=Pseudactinotalea sp. TaxID=1926260 RepID=UPI003B3B33B6
MTQPRHASGPSVRRRDLRANGTRRAPAAATTNRAAAGTPRHAGTRARHRLRATAVAIVGVLAFTSTAIAATYNQLQGDVDALDVGDLIPAGDDETTAPPADPPAGTPLNILIIGSDSRADGGVDDGFTSVLADTHIVAHISADRSRVELVSIPRDTMVDIPDCPTTSGETVYARYGMYNSAFALAFATGGDTKSAVACDVNLAQSVTGLTIDGWVLVEMGGFVDMVDALGGVDICIPEPLYAPKANLDLEAGQQTLNGEDALGYARARSGDGLNGSDTGRIERQQHLMSAMVDEVLSRNVLTDGPALYKMLRAALSSLTMSSNLASLNDMAGLALSLRSLDMADVTFMTTPYAAYQPDPNRLVFTSEVDVIWERMAADEPIVQEESSDAGTDGGPEGAETDPTDGAETGEPTDEPTDEPTTPESDTATDNTDGAAAGDLDPVC